MTRALETGPNSAILRANPQLTVTLGAYSYEIAAPAIDSIYTVTDGKETIRVPVEWAFGQGTAGQTYVFPTRRPMVREPRQLLLRAARPGPDHRRSNRAPHNLAEAAGRVAPASEMRLCFDCHATNVAKSGPLTSDGMAEGVQCERCHGAIGRASAQAAPHEETGRAHHRGDCRTSAASAIAPGRRSP